MNIKQTWQAVFLFTYSDKCICVTIIIKEKWVVNLGVSWGGTEKRKEGGNDVNIVLVYEILKKIFK